MRRTIGTLAALAVLAIAAPANAQPATAATLRIFNQGATQPVTTTVLQKSAAACGQAKIAPPTGTVSNPRRVVVDDPDTANRDCVWVDSGSGPLLSLPFGTQTYDATLDWINTAGPSQQSARSNPFDRPGAATTAPTGVRVIQ